MPVNYIIMCSKTNCFTYRSTCYTGPLTDILDNFVLNFYCICNKAIKKGASCFWRKLWLKPCLVFFFLLRANSIKAKVV